jgi:hypothetical protein
MLWHTEFKYENKEPVSFITQPTKQYQKTPNILKSKYIHIPANMTVISIA